MSSLWTPGGEHRVPPERPDDREGTGAPPAGPPPSAGGLAASGRAAGRGPAAPIDADEAALDEIRRQLLQAPPEIVIANHVYGLFELAALHLSQEQPDLAAARLAIDAMAAVVEGLTGRLGEPEAELRQGLANLQMAFVQVQAARGGAAN